MLSVEAALLAIAFISLPNLFYRAEFNVPLLLFAAASWRTRVSTCAYLIIISWGVDLYRIVTLVAYEDTHLDPQRKPILLISTIAAFVLKIVLVIYLLAKDEDFRQVMKPTGILVNVAQSVVGKV